MEEAYQLWLDLHQTGKDLIAAGEESGNLQCRRGRVNPHTGETLQATYKSERSNHNIRAWRGITSYLLADYRFLVE